MRSPAGRVARRRSRLRRAALRSRPFRCSAAGGAQTARISSSCQTANLDPIRLPARTASVSRSKTGPSEEQVKAEKRSMKAKRYLPCEERQHTRLKPPRLQFPVGRSYVHRNANVTDTPADAASPTVQARVKRYALVLSPCRAK